MFEIPRFQEFPVSYTFESVVGLPSSKVLPSEMQYFPSWQVGTGKKKRNFVFSFLDYIMLTLCLIIINMQQASQKTWTLSVTKVERSVKGQLFKSQCLSFSIVK